jgi:hypothetical protein
MAWCLINYAQGQLYLLQTVIRATQVHGLVCWEKHWISVVIMVTGFFNTLGVLFLQTFPSTGYGLDD